MQFNAPRSILAFYIIDKAIMKVAHRLSLLTGLLLLIAVLIGALGLYGMQQGVRGLNTVYQDRVVPLKDLRTMADLYAVSIECVI